MSNVQLTAHDVSKDYAVGVWSDFLILEWRTAITPRNLETFERFTDKVAATTNALRRRGLLVIVNDASVLPEPGVRQAMADGMRRHADATRSISLVYEATSLQATVLRTLAAGLTLMARAPAPTRVFSSTGEAAIWQAEYHGKPHEAEGLRAAAQHIRALRAQ
jgi:hypothetical protein